MKLWSASAVTAFIPALLRAAAVGASPSHLDNDHSSPWLNPSPTKLENAASGGAAGSSPSHSAGGRERRIAKCADYDDGYVFYDAGPRSSNENQPTIKCSKLGLLSIAKLAKKCKKTLVDGSKAEKLLGKGGPWTVADACPLACGVCQPKGEDGPSDNTVDTTTTISDTTTTISDTTTTPGAAAGPGIFTGAPTTTTSTTTPTTTTSTTTSTISGDGTAITYRPGDLTVQMEELLLSTGLKARTIARSETFVPYANGNKSSNRFHLLPDFGGTFLIPDSLATKKTKGGWVYVSNSEIRAKDGNPEGLGGVGAITFNSAGDVVEYKMVLTGTTANCGGGKTSWNTWITCEENGKSGQCHEVDPYGKVKGRVTVLGGNGGNFESFAYDDREKSKPRFFVTHDKSNGELRRFTPNNAGVKPNNRLLHESGTMEYLVLTPDKKDKTIGKYSWTTSIATGKTSAFAHFKNVEGIDVSGSRLYFVSKAQMEMFTLDLDHDTYSKSSTVRGKFDGQPDQVSSIVSSARGEILYFTEDTKKQAGVHGRDDQGRYYTILESHILDKEVTGLAFSPDQKHMYVAYQKEGILFDVYREDGRPFSGKTLNIRYHEV
uniref:SMP-30/Gluconolactonase/LRE-like region domain-containing protein n=1 Tax=Odontella aurita TaxID=265563 RepID=A0A7S4I397_9STRA|mmetsp:Transcript_19261/g.56164  ORF Transcript_19261/g.56164 Transcript_19261/m.56164 type:complete len:604 (+) Transcript_19261:328-2139(+)